MNALDLLKERLNRSFASSIQETSWGRPGTMSTVLQEVCSVFDTPHQNTSRRSIGESLLTLRTTSRLRGFLDLKYACIGVSQKVGDDGWILLEDKALFPALLREVRLQEENPRRFRKCFQGLLSGYFDYHVFDDSIPQDGRKNWLVLRSFLLDGIGIIERAVPQLGWVKVICDHRNLLQDDPCGRYGTALARGDYTELSSAFKSLAIARSSWVWEMIVLERMKAVCSFEDGEFKKQIAPCLSMINGSSGIVLSGILKKRCISELLKRYGACGSHPESIALRDTALDLLGNPWTIRAAWDAHVNDDGARTMVETWLKRRLITDFFCLLAKDRSRDLERLKYWLRFMPRMQDLWFALGPYAMNHPGSEFREFRRIAKDRVMAFEDAPSDDENALIMRIGDFVFVEFSSCREACQVFRSNEVSFDPDRKWIHIGSKAVAGIPQRLNTKPSVRKCSF